jgi:hypothetical protein
VFLFPYLTVFLLRLHFVVFLALLSPQLTEDDIEAVVDELSDNEDENLDEVDDFVHQQRAQQDKEEHQAMIRNITDGFKNSDNFSGGTVKRGKHDLNTLLGNDSERVKDLNKEEDRQKRAARGLTGDDDDEEKEVEEEKTEAELEAEITAGQKFRLDQQSAQAANMYETSEDEAEEDEGEGGEKREYDSEEDDEKAQMNAFSKRARMNRVLQDASATVPMLQAIEADQDSQQILSLLNRTDRKMEHKRVESDGLIGNSLANASVSGVAVQRSVSDPSKAGGKRKRVPIARANSMGTAVTVLRAVNKLKRAASSSAAAGTNDAAASAGDGKKPAKAAKLQRSNTGGAKKKPKLPMQRSGSMGGRRSNGGSFSTIGRSNSNSMMGGEGSNSMMAPMGGMSGSIGSAPQTVSAPLPLPSFVPPSSIAPRASPARALSLSLSL